MTTLPLPARLYIGLVTASAAAAGCWAVSHLEHPAAVLALSGLIVFCCSVSSVRDTSQVSVNLGFVIGIAAVFIVGTAGAILVAAASVLYYTPQGMPALKRVFNASQCAIAGGASGLVFHSLGGPTPVRQGDFPQVLFILAVVAVVYNAVNQILVWLVVALTGGIATRSIWRKLLPVSSFQYLAYASLGLLMAVLWEDLNPVTATLLLIPLIVTRSTFAAFVEQQRAYDATVAALIQAVETKDHYTRGHSERVSSGSVLIARQLGLREDKVTALRYAGMLHDVGKMGVPTKVLQKQGRLTSSEADAVRAHPARGLEMLGDIEFLQEALSGIYHHHERMDGKGYPLGLKGMAIPEFARVIMVADAFDSMTSNRSYRPAMTIEAAIDELVACSGAQFDPAMVLAMVDALHTHGWRVQGADEARLPVAATSAEGAEGPVLPRQFAAYSSVDVES